MSIRGGQLPTTPQLGRARVEQRGGTTDVASMSSEAPAAVAPEAEIQVAAAEAAAQAAELPSLEAGAAPEVVHIPVEGPPLPRTPATPAPKSADAPPEVATAVIPPQPARHRAPYAAMDGLLWALNRPFQWLSPNARQLIGLLAIVTLVISLLALLLLPAAR
jgi:hypothetical protein